MKSEILAKNYRVLTPEERFQLIVAAGDRGDELEQGRLIAAGEKLAISVQDHTPFAHAFDEVAGAIYLDLQEESYRYLDAFDRAEFPDFKTDADEEAPTGDASLRRQQRSDAERYLDLALAAGFVLHTKAEGWKLFCERLHLPPFAIWKLLPGFARLQDAIELAERAAFVAEGFLRWMNANRPAGQPELHQIPYTIEGIATGIETLFRERVQWWTG